MVTGMVKRGGVVSVNPLGTYDLVHDATSKSTRATPSQDLKKKK